MAVSTKIIKRRIRSVSNTKKITKAMELVSAAKMRKAVRNTLASRAYAGTAWEIVLRLSEKADRKHHPLFAERDAKRVAVILVSANRGLCGAFNSNIAKKALHLAVGDWHGASSGQPAASSQQLVAVEYLTLGKKARDVIRRLGATIGADFEKQDVTTAVAQISALAHTVIDGFTKGTYDRVYIAYTHFVSSLRQEATVKQLLPIESGSQPHPQTSPQPSPIRRGGSWEGEGGVGKERETRLSNIFLNHPPNYYLMTFCRA